jgi:hypothetical protein
MTTPRINQEVREAAQFIAYGHRHIPLDDPDMASANRTLQAAGVWSPGEIVTSKPAQHIQVDIVGVFSAGGRHRTVHMILADGVEIGTAIHWSGKSLYPWGLSLPAANLTNFGFHSREDLVGAVKRFVKTGEIAR